MNELVFIIGVLFMTITAYLLVKKINSQAVLTSHFSRFIVYARIALFI